MVKAMPFFTPVRQIVMARFRIARMRRPENRDRDARIMILLHQIHDRVGQIDLGVERLEHSHVA